MNREFIYPHLNIDQDGQTQVALVRVAEEASEAAVEVGWLVKEVAKALRFGIGNRYPSTDPTNATKIRTRFASIRAELNDLDAALMDAGLGSSHADRVKEVSIGAGGPATPRVGLEPTTTRLTGQRSSGQVEPTQPDSDKPDGESIHVDPDLTHSPVPGVSKACQSENDGAGEAGGLLVVDKPAPAVCGVDGCQMAKGHGGAWHDDGTACWRVDDVGVEKMVPAPEAEWREHVSNILADPDAFCPGSTYLAMALRIRELEAKS